MLRDADRVHMAGLAGESVSGTLRAELPDSSDKTVGQAKRQARAATGYEPKGSDETLGDEGGAEGAKMEPRGDSGEEISAPGAELNRGELRHKREKARIQTMRGGPPEKKGAALPKTTEVPAGRHAHEHRSTEMSDDREEERSLSELVDEGLRYSKKGVGYQAVPSKPTMPSISKADLVKECEKLGKRAEQLATEFTELRDEAFAVNERLYLSGLDLSDIPRPEMGYRETEAAADTLVNLAGRMDLVARKIREAKKEKSK